MTIIDVLPGETEEQAEARVRRSAPTPVPRPVQKQPPKRARGAVHADMPRDGYDRLDGVNFSTLKHMAKSPRHYREGLLGRDKDSDARKRGRATHLAIFEPERFARECVKWTGERRAGKVWEAFHAQHRGREILTADEYDLCLALHDAVMANPDAQRYLKNGRTEITATWEQSAEAIAGVEGWRFGCKGRLDCVSPTAIVDLKTTRDASPEGFGKEVWRYRYHVQAAWYGDGWEIAAQQRLPFVFIAAEPVAPYVVQVYRVQDEILQLGREEYRTWLERLAHCRRTNSWPGYADSELALTLPRWAVPFSDSDDDVADLDLIIGSEEE